MWVAAQGFSEKVAPFRDTNEILLVYDRRGAQANSANFRGSILIWPGHVDKFRAKKGGDGTDSAVAFAT